MSYRDPSGWSDPSDRDDAPRSSRHRARHGEAAPDPYPGDPRGRGSEGGRRSSGAPAGGDRPRDRRGRHGYNGDDGYPGGAGYYEAPGVGSYTQQFPALEDPVPPAGGRTGRRRDQRAAEAAAEPRKSRAGRNLPAAIAVGVTLAALVLGPLIFYKPAFVLVLAAAAGVGIWEMARAVGTVGMRPPLIPLLVGGIGMLAVAWYGGDAESLVLGLLVSAVAAMIWRIADGPSGFHRDIGTSVLILLYVPFLLGFGALLATADDGEERVLLVLALVVLSDTGGYAAGVFFGQHPMAPRVSPKKSWEGLAGSLLASAIGGAVLMATLFDVTWWKGALAGLAVSAAAVVGDLAESLIKRDLGVKDMSNLLPGHGGMMDRLDSVLFAVPMVYLLLQLLAPAA